MSGESISTVVRKASVFLMVGSAIGFIAILALGAFISDDYDAYGEVPIPGTAKLHLPAGQVTANFHTVTVGNASGGGLPVPHLMLDIDPPPGVASPKVTQNFGSSTSVNNDIRRRVWVIQVPADGDYIITTSGDVNGFIRPRIAFGHDSDLDNAWLGISAGLFVVGLLGTIAGSVLRSRARRAYASAPRFDAPPSVPMPRPEPSPVTYDDAPVVTPSDEGVRIEQLKTLAALRDSGALTEKEFQVEKRRVLDGD